MCMVRRGHDEGIDIIGLFVKHFPEVVITCGFRPSIKSPRSQSMVKITKGDNMFVPAPLQISMPHAQSHGSNPEGIARCLVTGASKNRTWDNQGNSHRYSSC